MIVPQVSIYVTVVGVTPVTVPVNCCVAPVVRLALVGLIVIFGVDCACTVTDAEADLVVSARLVAVTVQLAALDGAVYNPAEVIVPQVSVQLTFVFVVPVTVAVNCCVPFVSNEIAAGVTPIPTG